MSNNSKNIIGQKYGRLTVLSYLDKITIGKVVRERYLCQCECNNTKICIKNRLTEGRNLSCGCMTKCGQLNLKRRGVGEMPGSVFSRAKKGAEIRNLEFSISKEYIYDLFIKQNRKCALSGLDIKFAEKIDKNWYKNTTASLDRIDSNKGYIIGNVQWVHKDINQMKMEFEEKYFIQLCTQVYKQKKQRK